MFTSVITAFFTAALNEQAAARSAPALGPPADRYSIRRKVLHSCGTGGRLDTAIGECARGLG